MQSQPLNNKVTRACGLMHEQQSYPYLFLRDDTCLAGDTKAVRGESVQLGCKQTTGSSPPPSTLNDVSDREVSSST